MNFSKTNHPLWDINISNMKKMDIRFKYLLSLMELI